MKRFGVFLSVVAYASSIPLKNDEEIVRTCLDEEIPRTYLPEEEDQLRIRYIFTEDADGKYHLVDLLQEEKAPKVSASDVTFYLYTQSNKDTPVKVSPSINSLVGASVFSASRQNVFISHGWNNNYLSAVNSILKAALLEKHNINVFIVDWSGPANKFYTTAKSAVPIIGQVVGSFINQMMTRWNLAPSQFNLIGHSLGAHVAGCTGAAVNGLVNYVIGLDPAGPLYTIGNTDNRIDSTDGSFVQIIHTNGGFLGFGSSLGHSDYFPNGGKSQPGCGLDLAGTCAHSRAYTFLAESILTSGFGSVRCGSNSDFSKGRCDENHRSFMGEFNIDGGAKGDYYLSTNKVEPFALG